MPHFDAKEWTQRLSKCIQFELMQGYRKFGIDKLRAFAIDCHPWHENALSLNFLTDHEYPDFDPENDKWALASWRLYAFHSAPHSQWPYGKEVLGEAHQFYDGAETPDEPAKRRDVILQCCIEAINMPDVQQELQKYAKTSDFEIYVGHPDAPERNYYHEWLTKK